MRKWMGAAVVAIVLMTGFQVIGAGTEPPMRFLFLVDTSRSMARLKKVTPRIIHDLIASGFQGRIERGERFGIWTFNEKAATNLFPAEEWTQENGSVAAEDAVRFLAKQRFVNQTRMERALDELKGALASSPRITILILTDGDDRFIGTPFDRSINGILMEFAKTLRRQKKPFVIVLQGENGVLTGWRIHTGGGEISFPDMPDPLREAPTALLERFVTNVIVAPKTNSLTTRAVEKPAVADNPKPAAIEPAKPVVVLPPATAIENPAPPEKKIEPDTVIPAPPALSKVEAALRELAPTPPAEVPAKVTPENPIKTAGATSVKTSPELPPAAIPPKKPEMAPAAPAPSADAKPPRTPAIGLLGFAAGGGALLVICGISYLVLRRSKRPAGPSLISRSLEGDGKE